MVESESGVTPEELDLLSRSNKKVKTGNGMVVEMEDGRMQQLNDHEKRKTSYRDVLTGKGRTQNQGSAG